MLVLGVNVNEKSQENFLAVYFNQVFVFFLQFSANCVSKCRITFGGKY